MTRVLAWLRPRRIASQLAVVVAVSVVLIQCLVWASFTLLFPPDDRGRPKVHVDALVRLLADAPHGAARDGRLDEIRRSFPELDLALLPAAPPSKPIEPGGRRRGPHDPIFDDLAERVAEIRVVDQERGRRGGDHIAIRFFDGEWLVLDPLLPERPPFLYFGPLIGAIAFAAISSVLLALWAAHALVAPLRDLAAAAREFDIEGDPRPLPDTGPEEVRIASRAFDAMRARIRDLVRDRTGMLAAMGHDLRTPITRLRLRAEFVAEDDLRREFLRDLGAMNEMIEGALTYLREGRHGEKPVLVDYAALVATVCDGAVDLGGAVDYEGPDHLSRNLRPHAITRAVTNLVDNAVKHGTRVRVTLAALGAGSRLEVADDGPGIPAERRQAMLRPFVRGDEARNLDVAAGFGLGLAIVAAVVEGHGGRLELLDAPEGGLLARIDLPG